MGAERKDKADRERIRIEHQLKTLEEALPVRAAWGKKISGEGTMGMGRAFQYAGARCVLASLWSVEQRASIILVQDFFEHVKEGKSKLEALKLARDKIRSEGYDHPFFWAPFILVGEVD